MTFSQNMRYDFTPGSSNNLFFKKLGEPDYEDHRAPRTSSARNFWKSPYAGNSSIFRNGNPSYEKNIFLKPELTVSTSPYKTRTATHGSGGVVRGILKNKRGNEYDSISQEQNITSPRNPYEKVNLIKTGNDDVRAHGSNVESKSAGKRVKFNNLPKRSVQTKSNFLKLPIGTATSHKGRRLYFNKSAVVRVLGTPTYCDKYGGTGRFGGHSGDRNPATATLNSGESYIKSQINDFVKKLRLAESAKQVRHGISSSTERTRIGSGVKRRDSFQTVDSYDMWKEFDIERGLQTSDLDDDVFINDSTHNDIAESPSVSLESLDSPSEANVPENTPGGAEVYRRKTPMASLFTKYTHITNNHPDLKRYDKVSLVSKSHVDDPERKSKNFCDNDKTSQILGWLEDLKMSQGNEQGNNRSANNMLPKSRDNSELFPRACIPNTSFKGGRSNSSLVQSPKQNIS